MSITCNHCGREEPINAQTPYICPCGKSGRYKIGDEETSQAIATAQAGGSAFPYRSYEEWGGKEVPGSPGMTLRDYFAAKAMQAMVGSSSYIEHGWAPDDIASQAYALADTMLAARGAA